MFDLARQLNEDHWWTSGRTPLTSQKGIMDELAKRRAAMPKPDPDEVQEPMEYPDISMWTDYQCFDASSDSEDFDLEEFDYPGRSSKPRKQKPKPQPQSKPTTFSLSCSPPRTCQPLRPPCPGPGLRPGLSSPCRPSPRCRPAPMS